MKKLFLGICLLTIGGLSFAQNNTDFSTDTLPYFKKTGADVKQATLEQSNLRASNIFVELGGSSIIFSINGDMRFEKKLNGLGARIGIGYVSSGGESVLTVPVLMNYLLGKNGKYFEIGAGAVFSNTGLFGPDNSIYGTLNFGYRRQPLYGGFLFRTGLAPVFDSKNFIPLPYLSFGYAF